MCILEKLPHFNAVEAIRKYLCTLDKVLTLVNDNESQPEIEHVVEDFLKSLSENGFMYRRWAK